MRLVIVDTTQIQPYIFGSGSSRLKENIAASYLVAQATKDWALELLPTPNNVLDSQKLEWDSKKQIEQDATLAAEVVYAGGGNVVILFQEEGQAKAFVQDLSKKALLEAPGLQLVIGNQDFSWTKPLSTAIEQGFDNLANKKRSGFASTPLLGLGVTAVCKSTGLPAVGTRDGDRYSSESLAKFDVSDQANDRLNARLPLPENYAYPKDLDDLGRSRGEESHIAVVHADGNGMGNEIKKLRKTYPNSKDNREYILKLRQFSDNVRKASEVALQNLIKKLIAELERHEEGGGAIRYYNGFGEVLGEIVMKQDDEKKWYIPFRPIVFGGDDTTFVCDGRIGISLAIAYLQEFEEQTKAFIGRPLTACAGIAVVKSHYPFARAYDLADQLCKSAKKFRKQNEGKVGSALDWHFVTGSIYGDVATMREREYQVVFGKEPESQSLTLRPVALNAPNPSRNWSLVQQALFAFQDKDKKNDQPDKRKPEWSTRRNKVKALREALRQGGDVVRQFNLKYGIKAGLPKLDGISSVDYRQTGWYDKFCLYFDAIELMDWFIPLEMKSEEEQVA